MASDSILIDEITVFLYEKPFIYLQSNKLEGIIKHLLFGRLQKRGLT